MNQYILVFAVEPVQSFISAARSSHDLWAGSYLLSEIAKAVALSLYQQGAILIAPATQQPEKDLEINSDFSVVNKVQVLIQNKTKEEMLAIAKKAQEAGKAFFYEKSCNIWTHDLGLHHGNLRQSIWDKQQADYLEINYSWARATTDMNADIKAYQETCKRANTMLAARKCTRNFAYYNGDEQPKSSLDGARETVLGKDGQVFSHKTENLFPQKLRRVLKLGQSEQLDCMGVFKRLYNPSQRFTSVTRIAAHEWLEKIHKNEHDVLKEIKDIYQQLHEHGLTSQTSQNIYANFPYDAQLLYPAQLNVALSAEKQNPNPDENSQAIIENLEKLQQILSKKIWFNPNYGEPCSYFVLLQADGDNMGELFRAHLAGLNEQQRISHHLSEFAQKAREIISQHHGQAIYTGGDDVLALLPLHSALSCADELRRAFSGSLNDIAYQLNPNHSSPTLSVGLAICHMMQPFSFARTRAKQAEQLAKGNHIPQKEKQRNALGINLLIRSGSMYEMRLRWDSNDLAILQSWLKHHQAENKRLSSRVAHDCQQIAARTQFLKQQEPADLYHALCATELKLMLSKARNDNGQMLEEGIVNELTERFQKLGDLNLLANELMIARWLSAKTQSDLGREN